MPTSKNRRLGDLLLEANLIDEIQLKVALKEQKTAKLRLGSALVHLGFIDESVLAAFLSKQTDLPCVNIQGLHVPEELLALIPTEIALKNAVLPVRKSADSLYLAMSDPFDCDVADLIAEITGLNIVPLIAPEFRLKKTIDQLYNQDTENNDLDALEPLSGFAKEMENDAIGRLDEKVDRLLNENASLRAEVTQLKKLIETHILTTPPTKPTTK